MKHRGTYEALRHVGLSISILLGLAACGGGGADGTDTTNTDSSALHPILSRKLSLRSAADLDGLTPKDVNSANELAGHVVLADGRNAAAVWSSGSARKVVGTICDQDNAERMHCLSSAERLNDQGAVLVNWSTLEDHGFQLIVNDLSQGGYASSHGLDLAPDGSVLAALGPHVISTWLRASQGGGLDTLAEIPVNALENYPLALDVNGAGAMVANQQEADTSFSGFIFDGATRTSRPLEASSGVIGTFGAAIDAQGVVVGSVGAGDAYRPARWSAGGALQSVLPCPGDRGAALALNAQGVMAGYCGGPETALQRAAIWQGSAQVDVNTLLDAASLSAGWVVQRVSRINDQGWMIADASKDGAEAQPVLLRPAD